MSHFNATPKDHLWKKRKLELDPMAAFKAKVMGINTSPVNPATELPHTQLLNDPMLDWAKVQEKFANWQIGNGQELMNSGLGPQSAADERNLNLAQEQLGQQFVPTTIPLVASTVIPQPTPYKNSFNDPFSTVPGGTGFNPLKGPGG